MQEVRSSAGAAGVVCITGAAAGIGRATAKIFHERGWFVGALDVGAAGLQTLAQELGEACLFTAQVDVGDAAAVADAVGRVAARGGDRLDVMINNAGVLTHGPFDGMDAGRIDRMIDVNIRGVLHGARAALPYLRRSRGTLVSLSSSAAIYGTPGLAVYAATKAFVSSLTESLDLELRADGIRVVDILPGFVDTDMVRVDQAGSLLVQRLGVRLTPADVAAAVYAAATDGSGPVHRVLNAEIKLQRVLVGLSPRLGALLVRLVQRR